MPENTLYFGDNLDILRRYIDDESVDLIYLDPPFNSNQAYNVIFEEENGSGSGAQIEAFDDTWHWTMETSELFHRTVEGGDVRVSETLQAFRRMLGDTDMMAYLANMAPRLVELRRVLKPTGSIYLHCDPTASHYLKVLMDGIFGVEMMRNEIIWRRTTTHSDAGQFGSVHDTILFYTKTGERTWNKVFQDYDPDYVENYYRYEDEDGRRFMSADLSGAGSGPPRDFGERGEIPPPSGRHWMYDQTGIDRLLEEGRIYWTRNGVPRLKKYLDEAEGMPAQDVWPDVQALRSWHDERLGYPTQKPEELLERIIEASSNEGDLVLDPFCGCGTTIAVAHRLRRKWIGIDITHLAVNLMKFRLRDTFGEEVKDKYEVIGEPTDLAGAEALAEQDRWQFELWALGLVGARPTEKKRGADQGIDGRLYFHEPSGGSPTRQIVISVKSGNVSVSQIRDLRGVLEREDAAIGVFITLQEPTRPMREEAAGAGFWSPEHNPEEKFPKLQILTIEELLEGASIDCRYLKHGSATFKKAPKNETSSKQDRKLLDE